MGTIELLIAFLSYPPGENAHAPLCALRLPAGPRAAREGGGRGEGQRERESVECLPPRSNYNSNLIKSIRVSWAGSTWLLWPGPSSIMLHHVFIRVHDGVISRPSPLSGLQSSRCEEEEEEEVRPGSSSRSGQDDSTSEGWKERATNTGLQESGQLEDVRDRGDGSHLL